MTHLPPGSDLSFVVFFAYWSLALTLLCPFAWWAILSDRPVARRMLAATTIAAVVGYAGTAIHAAQITWDVCEACKQMDYFSWWVAGCFLC